MHGAGGQPLQRRKRIQSCYEQLLDDCEPCFPQKDFEPVTWWVERSELASVHRCLPHSGQRRLSSSSRLTAGSNLSVTVSATSIHGYPFVVSKAETAKGCVGMAQGQNEAFLPLFGHQTPEGLIRRRAEHHSCARISHWAAGRAFSPKRLLRSAARCGCRGRRCRGGGCLAGGCPAPARCPTAVVANPCLGLSRWLRRRFVRRGRQGAG